MILSKEFHAQETANIIFFYLCSHHPLASNYINWHSRDEDKMTIQPYVMHCKLHIVCNLQVKVVSYILLTIICVIIFLSVSENNICNTANQWKQHTAMETRYSLHSETHNQNVFHNPFSWKIWFCFGKKKTTNPNQKRISVKCVIKAKQGSATHHHKQVLSVVSATDVRT